MKFSGAVHFKKKGYDGIVNVGHFEDMSFLPQYTLRNLEKTDQVDKVVSRKNLSFRVVSRLVS